MLFIRLQLVNLQLNSSFFLYDIKASILLNFYSIKVFNLKFCIFKPFITKARACSIFGVYFWLFQRLIKVQMMRDQNNCKLILKLLNFIYINKSLPMSIIVPFFKLFHSILIIYNTFLLYQINKTIPPIYIAIQLILTLLITLIDRKQNPKDWKQIFFSLALLYSLRITKLNILRFLFLAKIFYVRRSLSQVSENLLVGSWKVFRLLKVLFDFTRVTVVFYMFLGVLIVAYKYWAYLWTDPEKVLSTHQILYFFMITSSSIGFGDITPKNQYQMYFLIVFIPLLIVSFGLYCGHFVGLFIQFIAILKQNTMSNTKATLLSESIWGKQECQNLIDYIVHAQAKNVSFHDEKQHFANNWLSLACRHYETHQPLLTQILDQEDSNQFKLLVASKLKRQLYPKNWKIIEKGNIDRRIFMIEDGEVEINGQILGAGDTFNFSGFSESNASSQTYITKTFASVWSISQADLVQIGRNSSNLKDKISQRASKILE